MTTTIDKIHLNHNYKADINYSLQVNRWLLKPIGIWPYPRTASIRIKLFSLILFLTCIGILIFSIISCVLNILFEEEDPEVKLKTIAPLSYWSLSLIRYCTLLIRSNDIRRCVDRIEIDWQMINKIEERETMLNCVKTGRFIVCFSAVFMHGGIFAFNIFKGITPVIELVGNVSVSIYRLPYPFYNEIWDTSYTMAHRVILLLQFIVTFIVNSVSVGAVAIAAMFVMHACGQLNIMKLWLESLVDDIDYKYESTQRKIGVIVVHHLRVLNFVTWIEKTLSFICLVEIFGSVFNMCFLGYYCIKQFNENEFGTTAIYGTIFVSVAYNIFIFCYIGDILSEQCRLIGIKAYLINWYSLPGKSPLGIALIILRSSRVTNLTAGKIIPLCMETFSNVVQTSFAYLNILRKVVV
ncbi:PREDICTED: odorant receptor 4-like [Polistes dominula]|uniref:Odorant receptor n=1 Tax=Polistes dominula TaxID=743375 RepID=A0ABM1IGI5_POLDO|nr:PREDICTED: odorant receptor 4-like [Polistes dominula]